MKTHRDLLRRMLHACISVFGLMLLVAGCGGGDGTLRVEGSGTDEFEVFDARGQNQLYSADSGSEVQLPAGRYVLFVNGAGARILVRGGRQLTVELATLSVQGLGVDTYDVLDATGERTLLARKVGSVSELLPGEYQVRMNGASMMIEATAGKRIELETGALRAADEGPPIVTVYDPAGKRLVFRSAGKPIELLPGAYVADYAGEKRPIEIKPGELLELTP